MSLFFFDFFFLRGEEKRHLINAYGRAEGKSEAFWYWGCLCEENLAEETKSSGAEQEIIIIKKPWSANCCNYAVQIWPSLCPSDEEWSLPGLCHTRVPSAGLCAASDPDSGGDLGYPAQRSSRLLSDTWSRRRTGLVCGCCHLPALQQRSLSRKEPPCSLDKCIGVVREESKRQKCHK